MYSIVREEKLDGIVMFLDDSNMHSLELFDEIQNVKWVGAVSVGILAHSAGSSEIELPNVQRDDNEKDEKKSQVPVQGPSCNSSNHLVGWHTFNTLPFQERSARYIGDRAVVLPRKLEWAGFVLNSRLMWEDRLEKPEWVKEWEEVGEEDVESPLSLLKDTSMVEPLGSCGRKVLLWWLRVEARADSKFPARLVVYHLHSEFEIVVPYNYN